MFSIKSKQIKFQALVLDIFKGWNLPALLIESANTGSITLNIFYLRISKLFRIWNFLILWYLFVIKEDHIFFMNHRTLLEIMKYRILFKSTLARSRVYISHFDNDFILQKNFIANLKMMEKIIVQNSSMRDNLCLHSIPADKVSIAIGGIDRNIFFPSSTYNESNNYVAISGDCKPRKNPQVIFELISNSPQFEFKIHGKGWETYFDQINFAPANLQIIDFDYLNHGEFLRNAGVLLSLATIEGGPLTILEALASGTPVVATNIGWWPDIHNSNLGSMIEFDASIDSIIDEISTQLNRKKEVYNKDLLENKYGFSHIYEIFYK